MEKTWGIVGIGRLGKAILTQCEQPTGIYHPDTAKAETVSKDYSHAETMGKKDLTQLDYLILALPAKQIIPFIHECESEGYPLNKAVLLNVATTMPTAQLNEAFPHLTFIGMKFVGHSENLMSNGNGLFVTDQKVIDKKEYENILHRFSQLGQVVADDESTVEEVNKMATYYAVKAAKDLEEKMTEQGFPEIYRKHCLRSILPEVIRVYSKGNIGQFVQEIVDELENERNN
ncbi:hypothetical protein CR194_05475 [Salipaludibacillus keqinensis]|uniref:6-phosphogluconate dehydrogenase NADP-binding domain-containing protein n=1 Tax=Salipaludibacillus keqinensis TaxID=2045207 RepID=A0A323TMT0_9BACI|nr:hypothetical protein [Salipaludibacillus keqinensis]PYZ94967.1 hypothetical protein CR194_05475 [Salipaludibacillus keqinensis]